MTEVLQYTKASLLLSGKPDPYNPEEVRARWLNANSSAMREARAMNSEAGALLRTAKSTVSAQVPIAGLVFWLVDLIGDAITKMNRGGFDDLPLLTRQRLFLQLPRWGNKKPSQYASQAFLGDVETVGVLVRPTIKASSEVEYARTLRNYLIAEAQAQEFNRITKTPDEPILPDVAIAVLVEARLYPPPLQPMPVSVEAWRTEYPGYERWYSYNPPRFEVTRPTFLPTSDPYLASLPVATRKAIAEKVSAQLQAEYVKDAALFRDAALQLGLVFPQEVLALVSVTQMMPRYGSLANPALPISAPRNRGERL